MLSLIAGMSENRVIGNLNKLPWYLSDDLKRFSRITKGHTVIMGRKTYESILAHIGKELPDRKSIVITKKNIKPADRAVVKHSLQEALDTTADDESEVFIIGGEKLFEESLPKADRLYLTLVNAELDGDAFFPEFDWNEWIIKEKEFIPKDNKNEYDSTFYLLERK